MQILLKLIESLLARFTSYLALGNPSKPDNKTMLLSGGIRQTKIEYNRGFASGNAQ